MKWTLLLGVAAVALFVVAPMAMAADHVKGEKGKNMTGGEITKIDTDAKAITLTQKPKEEGGTPETKVVTYDDATKVQIMEKGADGEKPTPKEAKIADLKVGQRVYVKMTEDGKTAVTITVGLARAEKKAKE